MSLALALLLAAAAPAPQVPTSTTVLQAPNGEPVVVQGGPVTGVAFPAGQQDGIPRDTGPQTGTARVRGRVTADTGQPIRHIAVQLAGASAPRYATTDNDGRFEFTDLPAGRFTLTANHVGYIVTRTDPVDVADGQHVENIELRLVHGGVIAGQIVDEFGEPVVGATVSPLRQQFQNGQRRLINAGLVATTNDIGEYRLFGLSPGRYYVSVAARNEQFASVVGSPNGPPVMTQNGASVGYAPTYYPGTPDAAAAQTIAVAAAQTVSNISFALVPARLARVSGVAFDSEGKPVTRGGAILMPRNGLVAGGVGPGTGPIRPDGTFTINNVPPGTYYVRVAIPPAAPPGPPAPGAAPTPPQFAIAPITVDGDDVTGLVLTPIRPAVVRGRVVFDDPGAAASVAPATVRVLAQRTDVFGPPLTTGAPANVVVNDDFSFELSASPERTNIRAIVGSVRSAGRAVAAAPPLPATSPSSPWRMKAVRVSGSDVTDTGIDLKAGEEIDDVEVEMTRTTQTLAGTVTAPDGTPASRVLVVVFPQSRDLWSTALGRYNARATTDANGQFRIALLPPGAYYVVAARQPTSGVPTDWNDPDVLEAAIQSAKSVSLAEGGTTTADLRLAR